MTASVLKCGKLFDGESGELLENREILVEDGLITDLGPTVDHPADAEVVDVSDRTVSPGFIDTHVHLTMDASHLPMQTLGSTATKALTGLSIAQSYLESGFTTVRDLGAMDPETPTLDLRNAIDSDLVTGPRILAAAHIISPTGGHGDIGGFYPTRWDIPVSAKADDRAEIRAAVRREHAIGSDWIKTVNAGGYFSPGDDPAVCTWFDDEMEALCATAAQLGMPVAVHTGAADACKQAIRAGVRSLEHAYLIDEEGVAMAAEAGVFIVPTMQMTQEDLQQLNDGTLPDQAVWKFSRDSEQILASQRLVASGDAEVVFGTDCGMFPFDHGVKEFVALVDAGLSPLRALKAATSTAARMLQREDLGRLRTGACADIVAMPGDPLTDISATGDVDFVMSRGRIIRQPAHD
ncbi:MAG: amidohydrolase family protein [Actinomycetota bacterium]